MNAATSTAVLLRCAAFGAIGVIVLLMVSPLTSTLAVLSPVLYAAVAATTAVMPMLARLWTAAPGAAALTAAITALLSLPFTPLGPAIMIALVLPAATIDLLLWRRRHPRGSQMFLAAGVAGVVIWALSFAVISPESLSPVVVATLLIIRVASYVAAMWFADLIVHRLRRSGVRPA